MKIRFMQPEDQQPLEDLWHYCFEKRDDPFFRWYFDHYVEPENILVGLEEDEVACTLHLNPYTIRLRGTLFPLSYIVGVATYPQHRRGGKIRDLLQAAFAEQRRRGQSISLLMPFRGEFYYPLGFEFCYHHLRYRVPLMDLKQQTTSFGKGQLLDCRQVREQEEWVISHCSSVYEAFTEHKDGIVERDVQKWRHFLGEHFCESGYAFLLTEQGKPQGYLFYKLMEQTLFVREMAYASPEARAALLQYCYNHRSQVKELDWNAPLDDPLYLTLPDPKEGVTLFPFMTARILSVQEVITQVKPGVAEGTLTLRVQDDLLTENNQTFSLSLQDRQWLVKPLGQVPADVTLSIGSLTQLIFGRVSAAELTKLGRCQGSSESYEWLDAAFPSQLLYINEYI